MKRQSVAKRFMALVYDLEKLALECAPCKGTSTVWPNGTAMFCKQCLPIHTLLRTHKPDKFLSIDSKPGTKVVYHNPFNGYPSDIKYASEHLQLGSEYTIKQMDVYSYSTNVHLEEVPGKTFNHAHFAEASP